MSCHKNSNMIPDPCTDPCKPKKPCGCIPNQFDHCIIISEDLECIDVERGSKLKKALKAIDEYLCKLKEDINKVGSFIIRNVGGGAELFKGISLTGRRDFRTLKSEDKSVKITEEEDEINLETPEIETNTPYIQVTRENGVDKVSFSGVGDIISSDESVEITRQNDGTTIDLGTPEIETNTPYIQVTRENGVDKISFSGVGEVSSSDGTVNTTLSGNKVDLSVNIPDSMTIEEADCKDGQTLVEVDGDTATALCLVSNTISITREGDSVRIESAPPELGGVPALIVNNNYTGVEEGTLVRPFRTLQNALDAYQGNGTRLNPDLRGATIVIQSSNSVYPLSTNINYRDIKLVLEDSAQILYTGTDWFLDMNSTDLRSTTGDVKNKVNVTMSSSSTINISSGSGIRNRGSDGGANESHTIDIGGGTMNLSGIHNQNRVLIDINGGNETGYSQPTKTHLSTSGTTLISSQNKIIKVGLDSTVRINGGRLSSSTVDTDITNPQLKAIEVVGGSITLTNTELQPLGNLTGGVPREYFIYMDDNNSGRVRLENCTVLYPKPLKSFIYNAEGYTNSAEVIGLTMTRGNYVITLIDSAIDWGGADVEFSQLNVEKLNGALVDMTANNTRGVINKVGNHVNAILPHYQKRSDALANGLKVGDMFIVTDGTSNTDAWYMDIVL